MSGCTGSAEEAGKGRPILLGYSIHVRGENNITEVNKCVRFAIIYGSVWFTSVFVQIASVRNRRLYTPADQSGPTRVRYGFSPVGYSRNVGNLGPPAVESACKPYYIQYVYTRFTRFVFSIFDFGLSGAYMTNHGPSYLYVGADITCRIKEWVFCVLCVRSGT